MSRLMTVAGTVLALTPAMALADSGTDEIRSIVAEMMADAQTRSSLLQSGGSAGYDGGFFIADASGDFSLKIKGISQTRYTAFIQDDDDAAGVDDFEGGFSQPRTKLIFTGNAVSEKLVYRFQAEFGQLNSQANGGSLTLEEAYFGYNFDDGWGLYGGQIRLPVLWEDVVSEGGSLAADISVFAEVFQPGFSQAVWLQYSNEDIRGWLAFGDGAFSGNTDYLATGGNALQSRLGDADYSLTSRVEFNLAGDWAQFNTMSSAPGSEFAAKFAIAGHYQNGPFSPGEFETEFYAYTTDLMLQGDGWNAYAAFAGRSIETAVIAGGETVNDFGFVVQGGVFIPETDWELFARYDAIFADEDWGNDDDFNTLTVGVNWYWAGQAARFTFDAQYFFNSTVDSGPVSFAQAVGLGPDVSLIPTVEDGSVALRAQFQLLF